MTLHFAYGSNMSRPLMQARCPTARALGTATLAGWRFAITPDGYGSIAPRPGGLVHGVVWQLAPRDLAAINAYESLDSGLYRRRVVAVRHGRRRLSALTYVACRQGEGTPRPGYMSIVVQAARDWNLPAAYIRSLARWSPSRWRGARYKDTRDVG
jgi:hypothetical protein